ncbi:DUF2510 domain-containing protein [Streptomyces sp. AD16]|nr:DUF2510 domain-containing protein [Streptomyces sp. AD16]
MGTRRRRRGARVRVRPSHDSLTPASYCGAHDTGDSPGWYPDPGHEGDGPRQERWWDGGRWTDSLRPAGGPGAPAPRPRPTGAARPPGPTGSRTPRRRSRGERPGRWSRRWWAWWCSPASAAGCTP